MSTRAGSKKIDGLDEATQLQSEDQFLFFQNSSKKTKRVSRDNMLKSPGVLSSLNVPGLDTTAPATPSGLTVTTNTEKDADGTEKVYIIASISANTETDLASYGWSIRRVSGTPVFDGGNLIGYGGTTQIFDEVTNVAPAPEGQKNQWDVRANIWYEVKVCAIDKTGNKSAYTALTSSTVILSGKDTGAPNAPTSATMTSAIKSVFLTWTNPSDADLAYINIYRNTSNTAPTIGTTTPYAKIMSNSYVDSNTAQETTYYYWLTSVDNSGNETHDLNNLGKPIREVLNSSTNLPGIKPGLVANTDITTFAVDATKMYTNTIILKNDVWSDNSPSSGYISWNAHTLVYGGYSYSISAGSTNQQFVYWTGGTTYTTSDTNPSLTDGQFMIATNADSNNDGNGDGVHDLAWNAMANAVIGSAYIQNAAITNAKISDLAADKITSGSIDGETITLIGNSVIKSSSATSSTSGSGLWIKGLAGGGSEFAIGDLSETNYGYLRWLTGANTLTIKGSITATTGYIGNGTAGFAINNTYISNGTKTSYNGAGTGVYVGTDGIGLGTAFTVSAAGSLTATLANITGSITATSGYIGNGAAGFTINSTSIINAKTSLTDANNGIYLGTDGIALGANSVFKVTSSGALTASSATITGSITSTSGTIGGWTIGPTTLSNNDVSISSAGNLTVGAADDIVKLSSTDGTYRIWVGNAASGSAPFRVSKAGALTATNANITGSINSTSGTIGGWTIESSSLYGGTLSYRIGLEIGSTSGDVAIYAGSSTKASAPFRVTNTGALTASNVTIIGGNGGEASTNYVRISNTGLVGVRGGTTLFSLPVDGSVPIFFGGWVQASDIQLYPNGPSNSTGIIRTSQNAGGTSGDRSGILMTNGGIFAYNSSGVNTFNVNSSNGNFTAGVTGNLLSWDGSTLSITGTINAKAGYIGNGASGFAINDTYIRNGNKTSYNGAGTGVYIGTDGIGLGTAFTVSAAGGLTASSATITGSITSTSGNIGGWQIESSKLTAGNIEINASGLEPKILAGPNGNNYVKISSAGIVGVSNNIQVFNIPTNGSRPEFSSGEITLTKFVVSTSGIIETSADAGNSPNFAAGVRISNLGIKGFKSGDGNAVFFLDAINGNFTATGAITATSGFIGSGASGFTINSTYIVNGNKTSYNGAGTGVYIGTDGIGLGTAFTVSAAGALTASSATITGTVNATSGYFGSGTSVSQIDSSGLVVGTSGRIQSSGLTWNEGSEDPTLGEGFFLGRRNNLWQFHIGGTTSGPYFRWKGSVFYIRGTTGAGANLIIDGATVDSSSTIGGRAASIIASAISAVGNLTTDVVNARFDTSLSKVLGTFTFGTSGALQIGTYTTGGTSGEIKISPNGITAKNLAGYDTFVLDGTTGSASFRGTLTATTGDFTGTVNATAGYFGSGSNVIAVNSYGLTISSGGRITSGLDWLGSSYFTQNTSGFFLGYASSAYRFFIGQTGASGTGGTNYLYWDGYSGTLKVGGNIIGGTTVGTTGGVGLLMETQFGIRRSINNGVLTITGGNGNGIGYASQIDLIGNTFGTSGTGGEGRGQLNLSAGFTTSGMSAADGDVIIRTSIGSVVNTTPVGRQRLVVKRGGSVIIGADGDVGTSGVDVQPLGDSGKLVVETSIKTPYIYFGNGDQYTLSITNDFGSNNSLVFAGGTGGTSGYAFRWVNSGNLSNLALLSTAGDFTAAGRISSNSVIYSTGVGADRVGFLDASGAGANITYVGLRYDSGNNRAELGALTGSLAYRDVIIGIGGASLLCADLKVKGFGTSGMSETKWSQLKYDLGNDRGELSAYSTSGTKTDVYVAPNATLIADDIKLLKSVQTIGAETVTSYIVIKDSNGQDVKLAVLT